MMEKEGAAKKTDMRDMLSLLPYAPGAQKVGNELENLIKWILSPDAILDQLEHNLRGEVEIENNVWAARGEKMMNDMGVRKMISISASRINKIVTMTNFDDKQIHMIMYFLSADLRNDLFNNFEKYEMAFHNLTTVKQMICDFIYAALLQAKDGGARDTWSKIQRVTTNIVEDRTKDKRSWTPSQLSGG